MWGSLAWRLFYVMTKHFLSVVEPHDLLRFRSRLWKSFDSGSGSRQYIAVFQERKNCPISCLFNARKSLFLRKLASHFRFVWLFLLHFVLDPDPNPVPVPQRQKVTVPAPQHWLFVLSVTERIAGRISYPHWFQCRFWSSVLTRRRWNPGFSITLRFTYKIFL
jgi:hypothetical protein